METICDPDIFYVFILQYTAVVLASLFLVSQVLKTV
uniref:Uncharacterized protein n=1 Tax=viral metagenome TaxID=1070528 RepID=A0A6C0K8Z3_9ZZZZ